MSGRIEDAFHYADAGQGVIGRSGGGSPSGMRESSAVRTSTSVSPKGRSSGAAPNSRGRDTHTLTRTYLAFTLTIAGRGD